MPTAQTKHVARVQIDAIADQVKQLHDQDDALSKAKLKTKVEQREVRLKVGALVSVVPDDQLKIIAAKSGYAEARLRNFSFVYGQWPQGSFPADVSYTPLEELARDPERFTKIKAGMSKRDARAAKGGKVDTPSRWSAATKAEFIKEALADPEVAQQITRAVMDAEIAADAEAYARLRSDGASDSQDGGIDEVGRLALRAQSITRQIDAWTEEARKLTVSEADKEMLLGAIEPLVIAALAARNHIESTDSAFATLLKEN